MPCFQDKKKTRNGQLFFFKIEKCNTGEEVEVSEINTMVKHNGYMLLNSWLYITNHIDRINN